MVSYRILVIGNGGREHALAWRLSQSRRVESIYVAPGNGGTVGLSKVTNVNEVRADDYPALVKFAKKERIDLVVPGPEAPLVDGIEGYFRDAGIPCFGPSKEAARMEGSKAFSKDFMERHSIPTAKYRNFTDYNAARDYLENITHDIVIKASGLAAGKGVIIPKDKPDGLKALESIMVGKEFGAAGNQVVIEEFLEGDELSILSFSDGKHIESLPPAQDHKRIYDEDKGPNTGGMGCYAPTRIVSQDTLSTIHDTILQPTINHMREEGFPFVGILFTGLMMTKTGPKVLEYNIRSGDPETQTLFPLLSPETDLAMIMVACTQGWLDVVKIMIDPRFCATVVVAADGYPGSYQKGTEITLDGVSDGTILFHAGTSIIDGKLKTSGGRVIAATATADNLEAAVKSAYDGISSIRFNKMHYRMDIAQRALKMSANDEKVLTYASAGVSIDAGNSFVEQIKPLVRSTRRPGADAEIGGFGGIVDLEAAGFSKATLMVIATDGVGTKLMVAQAMNKHDTVGIDLVAMNVNDLVVQGAEPHSFVDYYASSKLNVETAVQVVKGLADGCKQAGCVIVGGENAEMPGILSGSHYDISGTAIGAVSRDRLLPKTESMVEGDTLLGLASNGLHSNGFTLVRKIIERNRLSLYTGAPWEPGTRTGDSILTPTRIYVKPLLRLHEKELIKGMAHITGGGLVENIPRMLPKALAAEVDVSTWPVPPVLKWMKTAGNISSAEFSRTFNTGIGMVLLVAQENVTQVITKLEQDGETVFQIGKLVKRTSEGCILNNLAVWD
ncbi:MAG: hypothetical protein M1835_003205 [Candelina submexicana]|nr:MAG: hypothetical protein M1835_003205 [Candelina submexicana]